MTKYYTIVFQQAEPESLAAARAMTAYIADKMEVVTMTISENHLSDIVRENMATLTIENQDELTGR